MRPPVLGPGPPVEAVDLGSLLLRPAAPRASAAFTPRQRPATARPSTQQHGVGGAFDAAGPAARRPMSSRPAAAAAALSARIEAARQRPQSGSVTARTDGDGTARSDKVAPERLPRKDSAVSGGRVGISGTEQRAPACIVEFVCQPDPRWDTLYVQVHFSSSSSFRSTSFCFCLLSLQVLEGP